MAEPAKEFIPSPRTKDCTKKPGGWGVPMTDYEYIWYGNKGEDDYPEEACLPYYHKSAQIDGLQINNPGITGSGDIIISGDVVASEVTAGGITLTSRKPFDIPHPTKEGYRLRHVCLEGPESGVYFRGRLTGKTVIELPEYWRGLVDPETITVNLTQIGSSQDLIVEKIEWGKKIIIKSGSGTTIDCYYIIHAERSDDEKLIVEYEGTSIDDYPGDNSIYSINK
jgi:hypothetical protein|tara:strand:+ start:7300 stop:7971 length:672 start_codon:yes stop_codon:yes gene_type:complete